MESLNQKLYRSNSNTDDQTHFSPYNHEKIGSIFPFHFFEDSRICYPQDTPPEDSDFSDDPEEPLYYVTIPVRKQEKRTEEQDLKYNLGAKGIKNFSHIEMSLSMSKLRLLGESAKNMKYIRYLTVNLDKEDQSDADMRWLCNNVLKFLTNLRGLKIIDRKWKPREKTENYTSENGFKQLLYCVQRYLKKLDSLHLDIHNESRNHRFSPQFLRLATLYPTTCLTKLKHYNLSIQVIWEGLEIAPGKADFSRLIAFNKSKFLRNIKELELEIGWWRKEEKFSPSFKRSGKLALNIALKKNELPTLTSVVPGLFEHSKMLKTFHLRFRREMRESAAIFLNSLVKGISMRADTLQSLLFDLGNKEYLWSRAFSKLDFAFSGVDFAEKNNIKTLDINFHDDYYFCKESDWWQYDSDEEPREEEEQAKDLAKRDGVSYEPFTTKIIPQLTNLKSLKVHVNSEETFNDGFLSDFTSMIVEKLTQLEDLSLFFRWNDEITIRTIEDLKAFSDPKEVLPNLKTLHIDFINRERPYDRDDEDPYNSGEPIFKGNFKELENEIRKGRPETNCVVTLDGDESVYSYRIYGVNSDGEDNEDEPLFESGTDDSDENLSDFIEHDDEGNVKDDDTLINFFQSLKQD